MRILGYTMGVLKRTWDEMLQDLSEGYCAGYARGEPAEAKTCTTCGHEEGYCGQC